MWKIFRTITTWRRIQRLKRYARTGNLLEVGAGAGDFLRAAHRAGWEVKAVEYSINMAEAIHQELGFDVRSGELRSGLWTEGQFDVVAFWSVLEHLRDPVGSLSIAASYLKQGGAIFIQIPTLNGAELGMWFGEYWALLEFPRHLNFLDSHALESLCDKAGLDLILFKTTLLDMAWCYVTSSLNFANQYKRPLQRLPRLAALLAIVLLSLPWLAVQAWRGRGTEALAMAIKR
jgi:2-polyprenyl-3-methyl-5-hydroxy-6-metoxy-1,4-benzoquinol methylase